MAFSLLACHRLMNLERWQRPWSKEFFKGLVVFIGMHQLLPKWLNFLK
jgi:hypothetical protein